jgi:CubicO group peptidase (beta-lactamase class C family)
MRTTIFLRLCGLAAAVLFLLLSSIPGFGKSYAKNNKPPDLKSIVDAYAGSAVTDGTSIGVAVAVVLKNQEPKFFSYGLANFDNGTPVTRDTIFQLGSVTKIFTTALLGEQVSRRMLSLDQPLSDFSTQLGTLPPLTSQVTLKELGDFTAGFPDLPPTADTCNVPGALHDNNTRPTTCEYTAEDLLTFFQNALPTNNLKNKAWDPPCPQPPSAPTLPADYSYSDIDTGLLGLLLGGNPHQLLSNQALEGWYDLVNQKIKIPLGMHDTILYTPNPGCPLSYAKATSGQIARMTPGYGQALASAVADETGQITKIDKDSGGLGYEGITFPYPLVTILGGGAPMLRPMP